MRLAKNEFSNLWEKSDIQNQRLALMSVIDFSDLCTLITKNIKQALTMKKDFLLFLNIDFINLK